MDYQELIVAAEANLNAKNILKNYSAKQMLAGTRGSGLPITIGATILPIRPAQSRSK